ncbi:class F sortase [Streptomyces sp. NPDC091272]|uniref:class F sortase n=1 Tax=Streptomyces sp. NPDC091272 TaxID=3365981 RepID=UPI00382CD6E5
MTSSAIATAPSDTDTDADAKAGRSRDGEHRRPLKWRFPRELCLVLIGMTVVVSGVAHVLPSHPSQPAPVPADGAVRQGARTEPAAPPLPAAQPLRVEVPAVRIDVPLTDLALQDDGRLAAPPEDDRHLAGWWAAGPAPGTDGTAIIAGHVDVPGGPAAFYNLGALTPGMKINVTRADDRTARFTIDSVNVYDADDFPNDKVYADTGRPELRLITCGGGFDKKLQRYRGNVVVTAHLTNS